jgi:hypothetical protein
MNMQDIRRLAKEKGAKIGNSPKVQAIRMIQLSEGYSDCFAKVQYADCAQAECLFRADCLKTMQKSV